MGFHCLWHAKKTGPAIITYPRIRWRLYSLVKSSQFIILHSWLYNKFSVLSMCTHTMRVSFTFKTAFVLVNNANNKLWNTYWKVCMQMRHVTLLDVTSRRWSLDRRSRCPSNWWRNRVVRPMNDRPGFSSCRQWNTKTCHIFLYFIGLGCR